MLRRVISALVVLAVGGGVAWAEEIRAVILKVEGSKVTFAESKGKGEKGATQTLPVADNVKVMSAKFNTDTKKLETGDALRGGLKNEMFAKIGEKGMRATIVTDAANKQITEIRVVTPEKK